MASTQPLAPPKSSLRLLPSPVVEQEATNLTSAPIFDIQPPVAEVIPFAIPGTEDGGEELVPFSFDDYSADDVVTELEPIADLLTDEDSVPAEVIDDTPVTNHLVQTNDLPHRQTGYLSGVSLSAVLQMLHLERKTCVVDVSAHGWLGSLTLVNGELVDAEVDNIVGEDAAFAILNWVNPQTSIMEGVELFRHTVQRPITQLIMDAVRIGDETGVLGAKGESATEGSAGTAKPIDDWQWLIDSLLLSGARNVRVVGPDIQTQDRQTNMLRSQTGDLGRGIRTWATLLGPDCMEVVATKCDHIAILAVLCLERSEFIYAEAIETETAEMVRRSLRTIQSSRG